MYILLLHQFINSASLEPQGALVILLLRRENSTHPNLPIKTLMYVMLCIAFGNLPLCVILKMGLTIINSNRRLNECVFTVLKIVGGGKLERGERV